MSRFTRFDLVIVLLIGALGVLEFALSCRAADYVFDTNYVDIARSIANRAGYGFNHRPMTQLPPGMPYLLAWFDLTAGSSYAVVVRLMTVLTTLALIVSYRLLSVQQSRGAAAVCCLLLASSPFLFEFSTRMVFTDVPYWLASMLLIHAAYWLDSRDGWKPLQVGIWAAWSLGLVGTVVMRSAAISLLGALCCWTAIAHFTHPKTALRRLRLFLPAILMAAAVQGSWMLWAQQHQVHEWQGSGYQENYVAQLKLKSANNPELGTASWKDLLARPVTNADDIGSAILGVFTHKEMAPAWYSPGSVVPLVLTGLGLAGSFTEENSLLAWYFVLYFAMFLFWSWDFETRFLLPVAPLVFLYAWRGAVLLWQMARSRGRLLAGYGITAALAGCISSIVWGRGVEHPQMRWCLVLWAMVGLASACLFWSSGIRIQTLLAKMPDRTGWLAAGGHAGAALAVAFVVVTGVRAQIPIGLANLKHDVASTSSYPDIEAALWIRDHSAPSSVIMARKDDIVYHYSQHRVIWFPASHDPYLLMDGINRYHVDFVVVRYGNDTYWKIPAAEGFEALSRAYPGSFRLVHRGPENGVFEVIRQEAPRN